nr:hypothetical protein GCM10020093_084530 [Planobispora longispora]
MDAAVKRRTDRTAEAIGHGILAAGRRARAGLRRAREAARWVDRRTGGRLSRRAREVRAHIRERVGARLGRIAARLRALDAWAAEGLAHKAWRWWRARRTSRRDPDPSARSPETEAEDSSHEIPEPEAESIPDAAPNSDTPKGNNTVSSGNTFLVAAYEMTDAAAAWETDDMMEMAVMIDQLHEVPAAWATAFRIWADKLMAEYPCHEDVVETIRSQYEAIAQLGDGMQEISEVFRSRHQDDIHRRREPRAGEEKWNFR